MSAVILIVLIAVPLIIAPGLVTYFDITPKLAILYLGVAALLLFHRRNLANARALLATRTGTLFGWLVLAAWLSTALSTAVAVDRPLALFGSNWRRLGLVSYTAILVFVFLTAAWIASERRNLILLLRSVAITGILAGSYGIAQYFRLDPLLPVSSYLAGRGPSTIVRPPGTLGHADYFAAWLAIVVFAAIAVARLDEKSWARRLGVIAAAIASAAIVLSGTRGAVLGIIAAFTYLVFRLRPKPTRRAVALGAAAICVVVAFIASPAGTFVRARIQWSARDLRGGARLLLWRDSGRLALERPVLGSGPDTFVAVFPRAQSLELARAYPDFFHESPHNALLDTLVGQGILGLAIFSALCLLGLYAAQQSAPLGASLIAAFVANQFVVFIPTTALYFFLLIAILASLTPSRDRKGAGLPWLIPIELTLAAILSLISVRMLLADHGIASAIQFANQGNVTGAASQYRRALAWNLPGHSADLPYSRAMAALAAKLPPGDSRTAAMTEALESGRRAVNTSDDPQNAWYHLAILLSAEDDTAGVERCLRAASSAAPAWFKPHWALARVLDLSGRHSEALTEAADAVEKNGGKDQEVIDTLRRISRQNP